jgi:type I restriction enzyme S subunit
LKLLLFFSLLQPNFRERAVGFATGTTVLALPKDAVLNHAVILPNAKLVNVFNNKVESLLKLTSQNIKQSRTLAELRDALLPKLLSGEIRVREAEREVEQVV